MDYDKLVDLIVQEIYKKFEQNNNSQLNNKKNMVILWDENLDKYKKFQDEFNLNSYNNEIKDCDILIIGGLCLRGLSNLALGTSVSEEERFILRMLMKGKYVYLIEEGLEYRKYKKSAPKTLYNKYIRFEEDLRSYGIQIIKDFSMIALNLKDQNVIEKDMEEKIESNQCSVTELTNKKVISESDLRKPQMKGLKTIIVDKKSIITPLANDFIKIHHLKVKRV